MNWEEAKTHLFTMKEAYEEIGWSGSFGLSMTINPLVKRFESGERTEELYEDIMDVE